MRRLLLLIALLGAAPLSAQQPLVSRTLGSGTVVRLLLVNGFAVQGMLLAPLTPDAPHVVFSPRAQRNCGLPGIMCRVDVPVDDVRAIEIRRGSRVGRGVLIGAGVGVAVGLWLGNQLGCTDTVFPPEESIPVQEGTECSGPSPAQAMVFTSLVSGALGTGIGALFGLGSPAWERAP